MSAEPDPAARLCGACGLCCNGVLFYSVRLQAEDSVRTLSVLGLKTKRKNRETHLLQPCPAHRDSCCSIYTNRPVRCRAFVCRQLQAVTDGTRSEAAALATIRETQILVERVRDLFRQAGDNRDHKAFATRYAAVFTEPLDSSAEAREIRDRLRSAMQELEAWLTIHFRVEPPAVPREAGN